MKTHFFINEKNTIDNNKKYQYNNAMSMCLEV